MKNIIIGMILFTSGTVFADYDILLNPLTNRSVTVTGRQIREEIKNHGFFRVVCQIESDEVERINSEIKEAMTRREEQIAHNRIHPDNQIAVDVIAYPDKIKSLKRNVGDFKPGEGTIFNERRKVDKNETRTWNCGLDLDNFQPLALDAKEIKSIHRRVMLDQMKNMVEESNQKTSFASLGKFKDLSIRDIENNPEKYKIDLISLVHQEYDLLIYSGEEREPTTAYRLQQSYRSTFSRSMLKGQAKIGNTNGCFITVPGLFEPFNGLTFSLGEEVAVDEIADRNEPYTFQIWTSKSVSFYVADKFAAIRCVNDGSIVTIQDFEQRLFPYFSVSVKKN